ncbi:hypothetical protein ABLV89_12760 [Staphylococcus equorum]
MHYCLKDGHEEQEIIFNEDDVIAYNQYFNQYPLNKVPPLYCAKSMARISVVSAIC